MSAIAKVDNRFTIYPSDPSYVSEVQSLAVGFQLDLFPEQDVCRLVTKIGGTAAEVDDFLRQLCVGFLRQHSLNDF